MKKKKTGSGSIQERDKEIKIAVNLGVSVPTVIISPFSSPFLIPI